MYVGFEGRNVGETVGEVGAKVGLTVGFTADTIFLTRQFPESARTSVGNANIPYTWLNFAVFATIVSPPYPASPDPAYRYVFPVTPSILRTVFVDNVNTYTLLYLSPAIDTGL